MDTDTNETPPVNGSHAPETLTPAERDHALITTTLSTREREVALLIARGESNHEIAKALGISVKTYDTHRLHILEKLHLRNTVQLARMMIRAGLVTP